MTATIFSFFERQKRDLCHKSNEDEERMKAKEDSLNVSHRKLIWIYWKNEYNPDVLLVFYTTLCKIWRKR